MTKASSRIITPQEQQKQKKEMIKEYQTCFIFFFHLYSTGGSSDTLRTPRCARGLAKGAKMSDVIDEKKSV